jgi:RHS repeat-associated protein
MGLAAEVDDATDEAVSPLADGLGSVRARADEAGAVVGTADWDAWGNLRAASGGSGEFGWAGAQRDGETGLTLLGDRYYAPGAGRFLTRDVVQPNDGGTQGLNGYAYADGNPVTFTDPTGHGVAGVFAIVARVLECALRGECRYRRQHEATHPTQEAISGVPSAGHWGGGGGGGGSIGGIVVVCKPRLGRRCAGGVPGGPFGPIAGQPEERPMVDEGGGGGAGVVVGGGGAVSDEGSTVGSGFPSTSPEEGAGGGPGPEVIEVVDGVVVEEEVPTSDLAGAELAAEQEAFHDLANLRSDLGIPQAGAEGDDYTLARLDIAGQRFYGVNAHGQDFDIANVNAITPSHAEGDVFQQAKNAGAWAEEATLYVDRPLCKPCGAYGGVGSLMRGSGTGLQELIVFTPEGKFLITAAKPSVPVPVP